MIYILVDVIGTIGRQGLEFRGHEKSKTDDEYFSYIVNLLARQVSILKNWLEKTKTSFHNITYMSSNLQNLLERKVQEIKISEIGKAVVSFLFLLIPHKTVHTMVTFL